MNEPKTFIAMLLTKLIDSKSTIDGIDTSKVLVICHDGDDVCDFGDFLGPLHFTYAENAREAASFVVSNL